ncbi:TetR/AcrR family transcriptional regulator [Sphingobium subterraneum]|uniref:AcrR family transcriptional regulator n=1 Tax=Sphingobium subterraneum TaxID=627688 RepID=A0A841J230_9SPHN|nr:TetR/AcrR family transcriptional regulator [Sphingobium subterraneum]MBB6122381.1 AcrR family transcriptional regulator [Sphingobium subterraneum]
MAATKGGSWDRLLDAAEHVFSEKGYDAATTRQIAALSGDTLGTLSYHFKTKDVLLREVLTRRFEEMNGLRRAMYNDFLMKRGGGVPDLDEAITAIVLPMMKLALKGEPGWRNYISLFCRLMYVTTEDHNKIIPQLLDPIGIELLGWLKAACPPSTHTNLAYAYQFMIGCMLDSVVEAKNDRLNRISAGAASAANFLAVSERLLPFVIAGTKAVLNIPPR